MIINAQKVEHYEIAGYGSLVALAHQLGHAEVATLLKETLEEEKAADQKLGEIAQTVNALAGESSQEDSSTETERTGGTASRSGRKAPSRAPA